MQIETCTGALGAIIRNVDLPRLDDATFDRIKRTIDKRSVIVLRGSTIVPEDLIRFSTRFGALLMHEQNAKHTLADFSQILILSNVIENGRNIGIQDAGDSWHTDGSYLLEPDMYTFLYGVEIPRQNGQSVGNTLFVSTAAAYEALTEPMQRRLETLNAVHSLQFHVGNANAQRIRRGMPTVPLSQELKDKYPDQVHPVIRTHPATGRKCLYVSEGHTTHIVGLQPEESQALLRELFDHLVRPEFMYEHNWQVGDLVVWDNCATQHHASLDYALPQRRLMYRTATQGSAPF